MRILCFTNMWPTADQPWRGVFVKNQVDDLRAAGIDVEVFGFDGRTSWTRYLAAAMEVRRRIRRKSFDLIHAHYGLTGAAAALAQPEVPLVTTFHGSDAYVEWQRRVSRRVAHRSTSICVSREIARLVGNDGAFVIPMGVDSEFFRPMPRDEARRSLGLPEAGTYLLFPGRPGHPAKRYELFEAVVALLDVKSLILEPPRPEKYGYMWDHHPRAKVPVLLNAADAVLMTSRREGSPLTIREALAVETPVVSVAVGDVPEILNGLPGCAIVEPEPIRLANAVERACVAPRSNVLRQRAEESSRRVVAQRVIKVYREALETRRVAPPLAL